MYTLYMARYKWCHDTELKKKTQANSQTEINF